jgi:hypothetical protein
LQQSGTLRGYLVQSVSVSVHAMIDGKRHTTKGESLILGYSSSLTGKQKLKRSSVYQFRLSALDGFWTSGIGAWGSSGGDGGTPVQHSQWNLSLPKRSRFGRQFRMRRTLVSPLKPKTIPTAMLATELILAEPASWIQRTMLSGEIKATFESG